MAEAAGKSTTVRKIEERSLRADARRNRLKVMEAAQAVFSKHGPDARMEQVAEKAGVAVGTLYRHFPNKGALLEALISERLGQVVEVAKDVRGREVEPWEAFSTVMRRLTGLSYEDRAFAHLVPLLGAQGELGEVKRKVGALLEELVHRAQEAGKMRLDVGAEDLPAFFMGMVLATPQEFSRARQERHVEIILDSLRFRPPNEAL